MSHGSANSFRRKLKHILKNAQRQMDIRDAFVDIELRSFGLTGNFMALFCALRMRKCKGKTFRRIGRAALKQNKFVPIYLLSTALAAGKDARTVPFWPYERIPQ